MAINEGAQHPSETASRYGVRVLYLPASGLPSYREIGNDLQSLADLVGEGMLSMVRVGSEIFLFCDDAGDEINPVFRYNFSINGRHIHGDAFFVRRSGMEVVSLTDEDVATLIRMGIK